METNTNQRKPWVNWTLFLATVVVVFLIGLFASSIVERRSEGASTLQMVKEFNREFSSDNEYSAAVLKLKNKTEAAIAKLNNE